MERQQSFMMKTHRCFLFPISVGLGSFKSCQTAWHGRVGGKEVLEGEVARSDTNEVGEYEVTVTSELHAQAERTKKQNREGHMPEVDDDVYYYI